MWSECSGTFWKVVWCSSTSFLPSQAAANPKADRSEGIHARRRAYSSWMTRCASPAELTAWGLKGGAIQADHRNGRPDAGSPAGREARPQGTWGTSTQRVREKPGPRTGAQPPGAPHGESGLGEGASPGAAWLLKGAGSAASPAPVDTAQPGGALACPQKCRICRGEGLRLPLCARVSAGSHQVLSTFQLSSALP